MNRFDSQKKGRPGQQRTGGYMPVVVARAVLEDDDSAGLSAAVAAEGAEVASQNEEYGTEADLPMPVDLDVEPPSPASASRTARFSTAPIGLSLPPGSLEDTGLHLLPPEPGKTRGSLAARPPAANPQPGRPSLGARASLAGQAATRGSIAVQPPAAVVTNPAANRRSLAATPSISQQGASSDPPAALSAAIIAPAPLPKPGEPFDVETIELPSEKPPHKDSIPATGESPWWNEAKALRAAGEKAEALELLELLLSTQSAHAEARTAALELSFDLKLERSISQHAPHVIRRLLKTQQMAEACAVYRSLRSAWPKLELPESALVNIVLAGDHQDELSVVVDATNELVRNFPRGSNTARALLATAKQQLKSGRNKRAKDTLAFLIKNYPNDPSAALAQQKIGQIDD